MLLSDLGGKISLNVADDGLALQLQRDHAGRIGRNVLRNGHEQAVFVARDLVPLPERDLLAGLEHIGPLDLVDKAPDHDLAPVLTQVGDVHIERIALGRQRTPADLIGIVDIGLGAIDALAVPAQPLADLAENADAFRRDIAQRVNSVYSDTFVLPEAFIPKVGARLMSLDDPTTKMSKSLPEGCVNLMDPPEVIMKKFKRAVTDCETAVKYDKENKAGISNLLTIYCAAAGKTLQEAEAEFAGQGYGVFKPAVGEAVVELLRPIREESQRIMDDKAYLESVYQQGAERARYLAQKTLGKVQRKVGFVAGK